MCGRFLVNEEALDAASSFAKLPAWEQLTLHLGMIYPSQEALVLKNSPKGIRGELLPFGIKPEFLKSSSSTPERKQFMPNPCSAGLFTPAAAWWSAAVSMNGIRRKT